MNAITMQFDASGLTKLVEIASRFSGRTPGVAVATACYEVAYKAYKRTPVTDQGQIYSELSVAVSLSVGPRGGKRKNLAFGPNENPEYASQYPVPMAAVVVVARMRLKSNYNRITGSHYYIANQMGYSDRQLMVPRVKMWLAQTAFVKGAMQRMIRQRQSSRAFLKSCWVQGLRELVATGLVSKSSFRGGLSRESGPAGRSISNSGWGLVHVSGTTATAEVANAAGLGGGNATMAERHNRALWEHGAPALDAAFAEEALKTVAYIAKKSFWDEFSVLRQAGFTIDI